MHTWPKAADSRRECGPHQLQALLRTRGIEEEVGMLYLTEGHRKRDWTIPWCVPAILRRYGVQSHWRLWPRRSFGKYLRRSLKRATPVLFVINSIRGRGDWHWISAWGYDAATDEFLCYDSQAEAAMGPHGNTRYSATQLLKALPWYGAFIVELE